MACTPNLVNGSDIAHSSTLLKVPTIAKKLAIAYSNCVGDFYILYSTGQARQGRVARSFLVVYVLFPEKIN